MIVPRIRWFTRLAHIGDFSVDKSTPREVFLASLYRCLKAGDFIGAFYERFLASSDVIAAKFAKTDMAKQRLMLAKTLKLTAGVMEGDQAALKELRDRAETHDRDHLNIRPEYYDYWRAALIETAIEFDPQWDVQLHVTWDRILTDVIHHMTKHY